MSAVEQWSKQVPPDMSHSEAFSLGVAEGRRKAEAELAAERHAVATLANSMALLADDLTLCLNPADLRALGSAELSLQVVADPMLPSGSARLVGGR